MNDANPENAAEGPQVENVSVTVEPGHPETGPSSLLEIMDGSGGHANFVCKNCEARVKRIVQGGICVPCDIEREALT